MIPENMKQHFREIRECEMCANEGCRIRLQEPGLFVQNCKYLFIASNPAYPKGKILPSDAIMLDEKTTDEEFHDAYKKSQMSWYFYDYIKNIIGDNMDFSIINTCRCPTVDNAFLTENMVNNCSKFLKKSIELLNPTNIIAMGAYAKKAVRDLKLDSKYHVIYTYHYSFLRRTSKWLHDREIEEIKMRLK